VLLLCYVLFFHTKPRDWFRERLQNDLFSVEWDVKPQLNQSFPNWMSQLPIDLVLLHYYFAHNTTSQLCYGPFSRDHLGEPVPEENFWTSWCKGRLTEADTPTIWLGATPSGLASAHLHHPPIFLQVGCPSCHPTNSVKSLKAASAFGLGRRRLSSPQRCYLCRLRTLLINGNL